MTYTEDYAREAVGRGAQYLDGEYPGWHLRIAPREFIMNRAEDGVLAHLGRDQDSCDPYGAMVRKLDLTNADLIRLGFMAPYDAESWPYCQMICRHWKSEIQRRIDVDNRAILANESAARRILGD